MLVLDKITNLAGEDHEALKYGSFFTASRCWTRTARRMTANRSSAFPAGARPILCHIATVARQPSASLRNKDYVAVFTPSFRVLGLKRQPPKPKAPEPSAPNR